MAKHKFQIDFFKPEDPNPPSMRASIRKFIWSVTSAPSARSFTPYQVLSGQSPIPIDSALTTYHAQSIMLSSIKATLPSPAPESPRHPTHHWVNSVRTDLQGIWLTADENTLFIQICLKNISAYTVSGSYSDFWIIIRKQLAKEIKRDYMHLQQKVKDLIKKWGVELVSLATGDEDKESTFIRAIDEWIQVVDTHNVKTDNKKETAKKVAKKIWKVEKLRDNLLLHFNDKKNFFSSSDLLFSSNNKEKIMQQQEDLS